MSAIHGILKQYWGYDSFRPLQEDIIHAVLAKQDSLALLPTGGGKSICYQVPAMALPGVCIVISPLIALMKDQRDNLVKRGIRAEAIYSGMSFREIDIILDNCIYGDVKFLYVSPERLQTPIFKARFEKMDISFVAVDEAHCISQWGYDFRPEYLELVKLKEIHPHISFLAVTATATDDVAHDICSKLQFKNNQIFKTSFKRANLALVVRSSEDKMNQLVSIIQKTKGSAIVYANSRNEVRELAGMLQREAVSADFYHAGLTSKERIQRQQAWIDNKIRVMVCTNAFGMGIDKPDVRLVVHYQMPLTPEAYYQEAGRAGRDGKRCFAVILHQQLDDEQSLKRVENKFPQFALVRDVYDKICNFLSIALDAGEFTTFDFDITLFCENFKQHALEVLACIHVLENHGYMRRSEGLSEPSKLKIEVNQGELYKLQVASPQFDQLLNVLLRMYASLFDNHASIREEEIARKGNLSRERVVSLLQQLHRAGAVDYIARKTGPQIEMLKHRIRKAELVFDAAKTKQLYTAALERVNKMITYAHLEDRCRSMFLREYFNDFDAIPCGICDVCNQQRHRLLHEQDFKSINQYILLSLQGSPQTIKQLVDKATQYGENEITACVRWMLDNLELEHQDGMFYIKRTIE